MNEPNFFAAWEACGSESQQANQQASQSAGKPTGIGTLAEKRMHAALKRWYASDPLFCEVPVGRYIADVFDGTQITEIQTRHLRVLVPKLKAFLPNYPVRVVHPVPRCRFLAWMDPETGEVSAPRKCGKKGSALAALHELYGILPFLREERLTVEILLFDVRETRLLDGRGPDRKKGATRLEQVPLTVPQSCMLKQEADFRALLPAGLPERFSVAAFRKAARLPSRQAYSAVHVLQHMGVLAPAGSEGRATVYAVTAGQSDRTLPGSPAPPLR